MEKLNVFEGYLHCHPGTENRLTWALMNLIRMSPLVQSAFLDLVRQQRPLPALTTLKERDCIVQTQVKTLVAKEGRLLAIGITAEGGEIDAEIQPKDREAVYDGVVTFMAPEGRQHQQESLTLTVESKLGRAVGSWQLMPSESSLGEGEGKIEVDRKAVILAWRDIVGTLSDLNLRGLLSPAERLLIQDFVDYVAANHERLNPFDQFGACRNNLYLLNRRCEAILRVIDPDEAWHRSTPIIAVEFPAFKQIWIEANKGEGSWEIKLNFAPGDTMAQAREFWRKVDAKRLLELKGKGWLLEPNLHFSFMATHLHWAYTELAVNEYIELWKLGKMQIIVLHPDDSGDYRHNWDSLLTQKLISAEDVKPLQKVTTHTSRSKIYMSPGLSVSYRWSAEQAVQLDRDETFAREVKERIREATETWGEVPEFCRE